MATAQVAAAGQAATMPPAAAQNPTGPTVRLSMDDVIKLTLDRNLSIAVQRLNPQINDFSVANLYTNYHPIVTSTLSQRSATNAPTTTLTQGTTAAAPVQGTLTYNGGVTENAKWGGGNFTASLNNFRQTSTSNTVTYDPLYSSTWTLNYTQPLMQNFKIDSTREQIYIAKINRDMSDVQLRSTITNTVANAENAYWEYVYASQAVDVAQDSLRIANQLVADNNTRVEVGTMAPLDVLTAQSQEATAQQALVAAIATKRTDEIALKQFLVGGTDDPNWNVTIEAIDHPDFNPQPVDLAAALRRALSERTDLELAKQTVQENDVTMRYLKDQTRLQANLSVAYGTSGVGGTGLQRSTTTLGGNITGTIPGGVTDDFSSLFARTYPTWSAGVNFTYPLFQSTQQATLARARVELNQVTMQVKQTELQVATDVTNAVISVQNAVEAAQAAAGVSRPRTAGAER